MSFDSQSASNSIHHCNHLLYTNRQEFIVRSNCERQKKFFVLEVITSCVQCHIVFRNIAGLRNLYSKM